LKVEFDTSDISVSGLLGCFSIPSNIEYILTEIGIAINFYKHLAVDKTLINPFQLNVQDDSRTHTLFSMFSNPNQKQFIKQRITSATLVVKNATEITKDWEFSCNFVCEQFQNKAIILNIRLNITKDDLDIVSVSAESKLLTKDDLLSLPLFLSLLTPG